MPSDKSTVATKADFVPKVVGETYRDHSVASSARAHDGRWSLTTTSSRSATNTTQHVMYRKMSAVTVTLTLV